MCSQCNRAKGFGNTDYQQDPEIERLYSELAIRIAAEEPIRCCDDAKTWDWRAYVNERRALLTAAQTAGRE